ncbi:MAG TPA: hypothetical protein VGD07_03850 [Methylomirabilota bacterium]|jgi:hypothetical protein
MAKKPVKRAKKKKKASVKDLKARKDVKGGLASTRLGIGRSLGIT